MHLFVYGTLLDERVRSAVVGSRHVALDAIIRDFARYAVDGQCYPAAVQKLGAQVRGSVLLDVSNDELDALDGFEGDWYVREPVQAVGQMPVLASPLHRGNQARRQELSHGSPELARTSIQLRCEMYLLKPTEVSRIANRTRWSFENFVKNERESFLQSLG